MTDVTKIFMGIILVGLAATLVVNGANTAKVVTAGGNAFSGSLTAAEKG
jgi:hypothetical protein